MARACNVKDFGAVGDGATDDSDAFQATIDNCGTISVPPGTYRVSKTLICTEFIEGSRG